MSRPINKLTAKTVQSLKRPGRHSDGGGLYLSISLAGGVTRRRWVLLFQWAGRPKEMGLGAFPEVSLQTARAEREKWQACLRAGQNPIAGRRTMKSQKSQQLTFWECAEALIASKKSGWSNAKHAQQWTNTIRTHAAAIIKLPVSEVATREIVSVLQPIWTKKPETASRLRGRFEAVFDWAQVHGLLPAGRSNPARWRGHLDKLLARPPKLQRGHFAAMDYRKVPEFVRALQSATGVSSQALEFCILTAARTGEVIAAEWEEFNFDEAVWIVPASRMKARRPHRVPLTARAIAILASQLAARTSKYVFQGARPDAPLSNMSLLMHLRRRCGRGVTVHGFRSAFRDWAGEATEHPRELAEAALAHVIGDKSEQAYRRGDALERRRVMMYAWEQFLLQTS